MMSTLSAAMHKPLFVAKADKLIAESGLPDPIKSVIARVVKRSRLWRSEKAEVARELIAHFADGLSSGRNPEQLIADFGDTTKAAKLIRAGKKRTRPLWWHFQRRTGHAVLALIGLLVLAYIVQAIRFYTGSPTISRNYLAELNAPIIATPADQRGYPIFLEAISTLERVPNEVSGAPPAPSGADVGSFSFATSEPTGEQWPALAAYLSRNAEGLALLRKAAAMPHFGYVASNVTDDAYNQAMLHHGIPLPDPEVKVENPDLIGVLLPYLGSLRQSSLLLNADAWLAAEARDAKRLESDITAMTGLASHAREFPVLIGDLVAIAIMQRAHETAIRIIEKHPDVLTDASLANIAKAFAAFPRDGKAIVRFDAERAMWSDVAQRIYTDDGNGDGRIVASGLKHLYQYASLDDNRRADFGVSVLGPIASTIIAGRKEMTEVYNHYMDRTQALVSVPLWQRDDVSIDAEIDRRFHSSLGNIRYAPLSILLPALNTATLNAERYLQQRDAALVALAIERYRRQNAGLPSSLDQLVPAFLPSVPRDRFDGTALKYRRADNPLGYILYGVGTDLDDDQGLAMKERSDAPNQPRDRYDPSRWKPRSVVERMKSDPTSATELPDADWILVPVPTDN